MLNQKQQQRLEELEKVDILEWTDKDCLLRDTKRDLELSKELKGELKGKTVYTILRSVSASGLSRVIDMFYIKDGNDSERSQPIKIHYLTNKVFNKRDGKREGYKISGYGMDMGFALVSDLASHLFDDYKLIRQEWI